MAVAPRSPIRRNHISRSALLHRRPLHIITQHTAHVGLESKKDTDFPTASQPLVPIEGLAWDSLFYDICTMHVQVLVHT